MILLDFFSGSHGHFLEYVINTYIYRGPRVKNIFTDLGTCHGIRQDLAYRQHQVIRAQHYSEFNLETVTTPTQVVRITVDSDMENICYQLNVLARAGDIPADKKAQQLSDTVRNSPGELRMDYYSKIAFDDHGYKKPGNWRWGEIDHYEFPMSSLYNALDFYNELNALSKFLNYSFEPDSSLMQLWQEFADKNHGLQSWIKCNQVYQWVMSNQCQDIALTPAEQAVLNWMLCRSVNLHDGVLFEQEYPSNTQQIWQCVQHHLKTFDSRF